MEIEAERQFMHAIFGLFYLLIFISFPREGAIQITFLLLAIGVLMALIHHRHKIPHLEGIIARFERTDESRIIGEAGIKFTVGILIAALAFYILGVDNRAMIGAVATLAVGDSTSTIIGRKFGATRLFGAKSLEGIVSGTVVSAVAMMAFLPLPIAFVAAAAGMLAELLPINDNYTIPLATGAAIALML